MQVEHLCSPERFVIPATGAGHTSARQQWRVETILMCDVVGRCVTVSSSWHDGADGDAHRCSSVLTPSLPLWQREVGDARAARGGGPQPQSWPAFGADCTTTLGPPNACPVCSSTYRCHMKGGKVIAALPRNERVRVENIEDLTYPAARRIVRRELRYLGQYYDR